MPESRPANAASNVGRTASQSGAAGRFLSRVFFGSLNQAPLPASFERSLRFFNLYRLLIAGFFLAVMLLYGTTFLVGVVEPERFLRVCAGYLLFGVFFFAVRPVERNQFNAVLTAGLLADVIAFTLMMHYSGGARSGFGYMILVALTGASLVGQGRLTLFHAALASLAMLFEQSVRVLGGQSEAAEFLYAGIMCLGFFGVAISARLLASRIVANEQLAQQRGEALEAQLHINQRVIRDMQDGVIVSSRSGDVLQCNPQALALFAWKTESLPQTLAALSPLLAERFPAWCEVAEECSDLLRMTHAPFLLRVRFLPPGERGNALLYIEDVERLQAQSQQIKLAALGRLAANMAHEIRNPLAAISHAAELLGEEHHDALHQKLTRIIGENTSRLNRIVAEVLELGRRDRATPEVIRLQEFVESLHDELALNAPQMVYRLECSVAADILVEFDRGHLHRILSNLVRNAQRYCSEKPGAIVIRAQPLEAVVGGNVPAQMIAIDVCDDGIGVSESLRTQVFEPFFTTHANGTGLGLYIARELCESNGASIALRDNAPGAHFCITARGSIEGVKG